MDSLWAIKQARSEATCALAFVKSAQTRVVTPKELVSVVGTHNVVPYGNNFIAVPNPQTARAAAALTKGLTQPMEKYQILTSWEPQGANIGQLAVHFPQKAVCEPVDQAKAAPETRAILQPYGILSPNLDAVYYVKYMGQIMSAIDHEARGLLPRCVQDVDGTPLLVIRKKPNPALNRPQKSAKKGKKGKKKGSK